MTGDKPDDLVGNQFSTVVYFTVLEFSTNQSLGGMESAGGIRDSLAEEVNHSPSKSGKKT